MWEARTGRAFQAAYRGCREKMAEARYKTPKKLPGATHFSGDPELVNPVWLMQTLKQTSWAFDELDAAARSFEQRHGRKRLPGS